MFESSNEPLKDKMSKFKQNVSELLSYVGMFDHKTYKSALLWRLILPRGHSIL